MRIGKTSAGRLPTFLIAAGLKVWFDEYELKVGDSLSEAINEGLRDSRYWPADGGVPGQW
jgi:hypothetical protein